MNVKAPEIAVAACLARPSAPRQAHGARRPPTSFRPDSAARIDNPWFPLTPGTVAVYSGVKDGKQARDVVTRHARDEDDRRCPCRVVLDRL